MLFLNLITRVLLLTISLHDIRSFLLFFGYLDTFSEVYILYWFLCLRLQQRSIERAMDLTDSFTWEDLPTRDADTGHLTAAGWIPLIRKYTWRATVLNTMFHFVQSTIRIVTNHETILPVWIPFDWTVSPFYELVNISQVTVSLHQVKTKLSQKVLLYLP